MEYIITNLATATGGSGFALQRDPEVFRRLNRETKENVNYFRVGKLYRSESRYPFSEKFMWKEDSREIQNLQDSKFPEIKKKVLEEVEKTANLVEIMNLIGSLAETYTKKMYTTYREDEVCYVKTTLEKLERLVTYLGWYMDEGKYQGTLICKWYN